MQPSPQTPQAWCRHVLAALELHVTASRQAAHVHGLLAYFLEIDPSPTEFETLLRKHATGLDRTLAAAAGLLEEAWAHRAEYAIER